ncbi:beta-glucan synthesis-associated protein [Flagelloscypha sp. PMI_526]|nr:beta-glucan synthesis-associated protein [Flagelloscypha sp. PMI_526]
MFRSSMDNEVSEPLLPGNPSPADMPPFRPKHGSRPSFSRTNQPLSMVSTSSSRLSLPNGVEDEVIIIFLIAIVYPNIPLQFGLVEGYNWATPINVKEDDDFLHTPSKGLDKRGHIFTARGISNLGCLAILVCAALALFVGYPIADFVRRPVDSSPSFGLGGTNASGQVPVVFGNVALVDKDTPDDVKIKKSYNGGKNMKLVFSDEFNHDGRSFYPGDDPYWEAVDLHYAATGNMEWYDPQAITTANGALEITLSRKNEHDLDFQGGMIATWNKFCFTGGMIETAVQLPGMTNVRGLWPAVWMMGNLGRAGYGATTEGLWPYSYDECDVGAAPNQTIGGLPEAATTSGSDGGALSWLPGQRLSRCTCPGEKHPGPTHSDGTYVGRSSPEIDIFEAQIEDDGGHVSQSAQWAPFNHAYEFINTTTTTNINDLTVSKGNPYKGGILQQATSVVSKTNQDCYDQSGTGCFTVIGVEYKPGFDNAYITWLNDNKVTWTIQSSALAADPLVQIKARPISQEPMYIIANLGISNGFQTVDLANLKFPTTMRIDWIRVYQPEDEVNIGCNPKDFPTASYIEDPDHINAYMNPNYTTWTGDFGAKLPKNSITGTC